MSKERNKRKVYKYKYKPRKKRKNNRIFRKVLSVFEVILILAVFVVLGYTIAGPIINMMHADKNIESTAEISTSQKEIQVVTNVENDIPETFTSESQEGQKKNTVKYSFSAVEIPDSSLESLDSLETSLENVKKNDTNKIIKNIVVPLKLTGGELNFSSVNKNAIEADAVISDLALKDIYSEIDSFGYSPVAEISLLEDAIYSKYNVESAFTTKNGSRWIDNDLSSGGKSWLDPSKDECKKYLKSIATEIVSAGFEIIVCTDVEYPAFRQSDINYIGDSVSESLRYRNLTDLVNEIQDAVSYKNTEVYVYEDIIKYISGESEVVKKESLKSDGIIFNINLDSIKSESIGNSTGEKLDLSGMEDERAIAEIIDFSGISELEKFDIGFEYEGKDIDNDKLQTISENIYMMGYASYILKSETE